MARPALSASVTRLFLGCLLAAGVPLAIAHHSVAGQFDVSKTVTLSGVVGKVHWVNPHFYLDFAVTQPAAQAVTWRLEGVPVGIARKAGLSKAMLEGDGETVTIVAHPARDGTPHLGYLIKITYPDGKVYQFAADGPGG